MRIDGLAEAYLAYESRRKKPRTVRNYRGELRRVTEGIGARFVSDLTMWKVEARVASMKAAGRRDRTVNLHVGSLVRLLNWAVRQERISDNPIAKWGRLPERDKRYTRALTRKEFRLLIKHAHSCGGRGEIKARQRCQMRNVWILLGETGMRPRELAGLRWSDIDFVERLIHLPRGKTAASERNIPMTQRVLEVLRLAMLAGLGKPVGAILNHLGEKLQACLTAAGIAAENVRPYSLRISFATWLCQGGASPLIVKDLMGHENIELVMRVYGRTLPGDARHAVNILNADHGEDGGCRKS